MNDSLTDVPNLLVGHSTDLEAATGCTVVLTPQGACAGVDVRGAAPGTRETALLAPGRLVNTVHAILLTGGSAFGLAAADGVVRWLEEHHHGVDTGVARVPIVPAAVLFDLIIGDARHRPGPEAGYAACQAASRDKVAQGNVGAGTGATVGKLLGPAYCSKGGLGSASVRIGKGITVAALVAVNAFGDVVDPEENTIIAGTRRPVVGGFVHTAHALRGSLAQTALNFIHNTTLGVVATDARLDKAELTMLAGMAHDGFARAIRPVHTLVDGDTIFALSTGDKKGNLSAIGSAAAEVMAEAIVRGVRAAETLHGVPAARELVKGGERGQIDAG
ncbi:MAG: P1 family peptidase [Ardenticatenaceae bacterium]|nr:P1 family peptidase [Ardenticatenaceae bacterium]HBY95529.1 peptidase S58 [Chloroflexota bacterium]